LVDFFIYFYREETIILLPEKVHYVFLSATVPNAPEFAAWIAKIHHQPVHVVYTEFRPTPLQHYIYPSGGEGVHLVVDEKGDFREDNFQRALSVLAPDPLGEEGDASTSKKRKKQTKGGPSEIYKIVKMIMERKYEPVIVFGFARKECERMASQMAKLDVQGAEEKKLVEEVFKNAIQTLSEEDRKLPQIQQMLPLLRRGIGIHHSGLLPILKEVIEILFQENLLKCLFATETFSIGLNMPARTVVFTSLRKFDGEKFRWVSSGEYIQMSGRAGRRGLDDRGIVIMMLDEKMEPDVCKGMLRGKADVLRSSFHLSYNMLLNLMRVDEIRAEDLLQKSFLQFQNQRALPELHARRRQLERARLAVEVPHEAECAAFLALERQITASEAEIHAVVTKPVHIVPFLQPGRLVKVVEPSSAAGGGAGADWGWGAVVCYTRRARAQQHGGTRTEAGIEHDQPSQYVLDVLLACNPDQTLARPEPPQP
jgi:ATP-dependent RNA helicase DOB1